MYCMQYINDSHNASGESRSSPTSAGGPPNWLKVHVPTCPVKWKCFPMANLRFTVTKMNWLVSICPFRFIRNLF